MKNCLLVQNLNNSILNNINLILDESTTSVLIGKSGSGKTSLLKSIAGILNYNGTVLLNEKSIYDKNKLSKYISLYIGIVNLSNKNVISNLIEPLENLGLSNSTATKRAYELLKKLDINNLAYKNINELSFSETRIVSLAKSIINNGKLILLDNPFESLDVYYKTKVLNYLKQMQEKNKSIIIFTTNDSEDLLIADNILVMDDGELIINQSKEKLFEKEKSLKKSNMKQPFLIELSHKLKSYELIDEVMYNMEEMVDVLWK